MKEILIVSHCILNTASKVAQDESMLAEEYKMRDELLRLIIRRGIQVIQLPCPEFRLYGSRRWGHVKDQFMHPHFRRESDAILAPVLDEIEEYLTYPEEFNVIGIVSVEGSPSCGYRQTCSADWKGEILASDGSSAVDAGSLRITNEPGAFMEAVENGLSERELGIPILTMKEAVTLLRKRRTAAG